jgi:hypothetical protein
MLTVIAILLAIIASTLLFGVQITLIALGCLVALGALIMLIKGITLAIQKDPMWLVVGLILLVAFGVMGVNTFAERGDWSHAAPSMPRSG